MKKKHKKHIIEDTRQKPEKHESKHRGFDRQGVEVYRSKLPVGDYALPPSCVVDTKADIAELAENLLGSRHERERFEAELAKAHEWGSRLVVLVEDDRLDSFEEIRDASVQHPAGYFFPGSRVLEEMGRMNSMYGTEFRVCHKKDSAKVIIETLQQY